MTESTIRYETPAPGVARIVLARADKHNAINPQMIYDVNEAFNRAVRDESVKVIILGADGRNFSAGHDIAGTVAGYQADTQQNSPGVSTWSDFTEEYTHGWYAAEKETYLESARRWRNLSKPTICTVQGKCIAGALIFAWVCDIIVASKDAVFSDPVVTFGVSGVEWLGHPWELGARKAKEFLFTSDTWSADEAHRLGMVNHVVEPDAVLDRARELAERICRNAPLAVRESLAIAREALLLSDEQAWERSAEAMTRVRGSEDAREGVTAFIEKRDARWTGR